MRRSARLRYIALIAMLATLVVSRPTSGLQAADFPIGWYDTLMRPRNLSAFASQGLSTALPYDSVWGNPATYLDAARSSGRTVMLEIPRDLVKNVDTAGVKRFVSLYKAHPALRGWYLADEPSINSTLGPLSPANAKKLYDAIKTEDAATPVSIAFSSGEDPAPYLPALDVVMHDDYPAVARSAEFQHAGWWASQTSRFAAAAQNEQGFYPILQGFGGTNAQPVLGRRLPTAKEERYMAYTALQLGADGLFFWAYFQSDPTWMQNVVVPLVAELQPLRPALAAGSVAGLVSSGRNDVGVAAFRDPVSGRRYVLSIHHGPGTIAAPLTLTGALATVTKATLMGPTPKDVAVVGGRLDQTLAPYEVKAYRIG